MPRDITFTLPDQANNAQYGLTAEEFQRMLDHSGASPEKLVSFALSRLSEEFGTRTDIEAANDQIAEDAIPASENETRQSASSLLRLLSQGEDDATIKPSPSR